LGALRRLHYGWLRCNALEASVGYIGVLRGGVRRLWWTLFMGKLVGDGYGMVVFPHILVSARPDTLVSGTTDGLRHSAMQWPSAFM
jgi:hypothetical protein